MCKNIYLVGLCKTRGEYAQTPTHMQVQESPWVRQQVWPCQGESLPVPQGWIPPCRGSRKGSETLHVAVAISGNDRVLADTELVPRAVHRAQQLSGTTAYAHQCVLESSGFTQLHAQLGATSTYLAEKVAHTCSICIDLPTWQTTMQAARRAHHHQLSNLGVLPNQPCTQQGLCAFFGTSRAFYFMKV